MQREIREVRREKSTLLGRQASSVVAPARGRLRLGKVRRITKPRRPEVPSGRAHNILTTNMDQRALISGGQKGHLILIWGEDVGVLTYEKAIRYLKTEKHCSSRSSGNLDREAKVMSKNSGNGPGRPEKNISCLARTQRREIKKRYGLTEHPFPERERHQHLFLTKGRCQDKLKRAKHQ